jgi:hypothetical protein
LVVHSVVAWRLWGKHQDDPSGAALIRLHVTAINACMVVVASNGWNSALCVWSAICGMDAVVAANRPGTP